MSKYRVDDGEARDWDGSNHIGRASGSQWHAHTLYRSRKGRYYVEHRSSMQGHRDHAEWVSPEEATRWLMQNDHELPEELKHFEDEVSE